MIKAQTKRLVRSLFVMRCGYCGVSERDVGSTLTFDHYQPQAEGGSDDLDNLVYACHACNEYKGNYWQGGASRLLHPLRDHISQHINEESDGILVALNELGTIYISQLQLNRTPLIAYRVERRNRQLARTQRTAETALLEEILREIQQLKDSLRAM